MDVSSLRDRLRRQERLDEGWLHLFALEEMIRVLRSEEGYRASGHTGLLLLKTEYLRVVLEVARSGNEIAEHLIHGPTLIQVMQGSLHLESMDETRIAHAGEMVVVPHDRPRRMRAIDDVAFLRTLCLES